MQICRQAMAWTLAIAIAITLAALPATAWADESAGADAVTNDTAIGTSEPDSVSSDQVDAESQIQLASTQKKSYTVGAKNTTCSITKTVTEVWYEFTLSQSGTIALSGFPTISNGSIYYSLYDSGNKRVDSGKYMYESSTSFEDTFYLNKGTYTLRFCAGSAGYHTGSVKFSTSFAASGESFSEAEYGSNNSQSAAQTISVGKQYRSFFSQTDDKDYYKFTVSSAGTYTFWGEPLNDNSANVTVTDASGNKVGNTYFSSYSSGSNYELSSGTYYLFLQRGSYYGAVDFKVSVASQAMYRLYNPNSGEHFYTASTSERDKLKRVGWSYEGIGWNAPKTSSTPVYRLYSGTDHHYTTSVAEKNNLVRAGWKYEGVGWYSDDAKGQALYRQYNPNVNPKAKRNNSGSHNYTTSKAENDQLVKAGWKAEGIGWWGVK